MSFSAGAASRVTAIKRPNAELLQSARRAPRRRLELRASPTLLGEVRRRAELGEVAESARGSRRRRRDVPSAAVQRAFWLSGKKTSRGRAASIFAIISGRSGRPPLACTAPHASDSTSAAGRDPPSDRPGKARRHSAPILQHGLRRRARASRKRRLAEIRRSAGESSTRSAGARQAARSSVEPALPLGLERLRRAPLDACVETARRGRELLS